MLQTAVSLQRQVIRCSQPLRLSSTDNIFIRHAPESAICFSNINLPPPLYRLNEIASLLSCFFCTF